MASVLDTVNALITLAELKSYLASDTGDEFLTGITYDNELERLINSASMWANEYTGVDLLARVQTEYYDGDGTDTLFLHNFPIGSVASEIVLHVDTDRDYEDGTLIDTDYIIVYSTLGKIVLSSDVFSIGSQTVKIVYTAGHGAAADPSDVPADIKYAIKMICSALWKSQKNRMSGIQSITTDGQSVTIKESLFDPDVKLMLEPYSRLKWGL